MLLEGELYDILSSGQEGTARTFSLRLRPESVIYTAHFPGHPVTPGACLLQMVTELVWKATGRPLKLEGVKNAKFLRVLAPAEVPVVTVAVECEETEDGCRVHAEVKDDTGLYAKLSLMYE